MIMNETKAKAEKKRFDYRHIICIIVTLGFIAVGVFVFPNALIRIIEGGRDFGKSVAYYVCEMFGLPYSITPTINDLPQSPANSSITLPTTYSGFKSKFAAYWRLWASGENFVAYLSAIGNFVSVLCKIIIIALPVFLVVWLLFKGYLKKENNDYDRDSKPLRAFKFVAHHLCRPVKQWLVGLYGFIREHKPYYITWLLMWLFYFNAFTIILEFLAFYLYFVVSFDVGNIYRQVYKLFLDLWVAVDFIPLWVWAILGIVLFDRFRKGIAYARLHHYELRNRGFINARPVGYMLNGTMGTGKTTAGADMGLSADVMFRDKAFEKILENDLKFPFFPWCNLENELRRAMAFHVVYNLATTRAWVRKKAARWHAHPAPHKCFGYDYERYGLNYDDKLKVVNVWEIIEIYAQLYFIYVIQSSLLLANYSIRVDNLLADLGNFPMWNSDFFHRDSRLIDAYSRHAHILDFDALRLGRKLIQDNPNADSFEFGVVLITEVGKERGNKLDHDGIKKFASETNQKNDGFNKWLKMIRHSATVDNYPFVKVIMDEQRPESLGADARELCEIVHIRSRSETRLAMPFFSLAELLYSWLFGKFAGLYYQYRFVRSDNTLPMYLLKAITAKIHHYYTGIYGRFGYAVLAVQVESGTQDGQLDNNKYFIMSKKIYSKRFSTDCFSDFFAEKSMRSPVGIDDLREYVTEKATFAELQAQNSYFVNDLLGGLHNENER